MAMNAGFFYGRQVGGEVKGSGRIYVMLPLWRDGRFWAAMMLGPLFCGAMTLWLPRTGIDYAAQWRWLLWLVVIYPVVEELLFRGGLQPLLLKSTWGRTSCSGISLANVLTSLAFAALHLLGHQALWALLVFAPSLLFGWFRERYDSTVPPILLHGSYNLAYFITFGLPG